MKPTTKPNEKPRAFSYQRFSTPEQLKGDSLRRQSEAAERYAEANGLDLDTELVFQDLGVSAYRGANFEAALGRFISAVDDGRVPQGSYLLIENLDRFSRDRIMPALTRFNDLLKKGIRIVTLSDGQVYDAESLNNLTGLLVPLVTMSRANEESEMKSKRGRAAWDNNREKAREGYKISTAAPAWITLDGQEWKVDPAKARVVERIFKLALEGHGPVSISKRLNKEQVPPIGNSDAWAQSYIYSILRNHAVIGTYQPNRLIPGSRKREPAGEAIDGYFPAIIDKGTFYRVQRAPKGVSGSKGRVLTNMLSGLLRCAICHGAVHYINRGGSRKAYVHCDNARRKFTCPARSVRYDMVLSFVLNQVDFDTPWLLGQEQEDKKDRGQRQLYEIEGRIEELKEKNANIVANLELAPSKALAEKLVENEAAIEKFQTWHENVSNHVASLGQNGNHLTDTREAVEEFNRVMASGDEGLIGAIRVRLNASLKKLIERIEIGPGPESWNGVRIIAKGKLPTPTMAREIDAEGLKAFVEK